MESLCSGTGYVGSFVSEKESSLTVKEKLDEVVGPDLSDNGLTDSKTCQSLALRLSPDREDPHETTLA